MLSFGFALAGRFDGTSFDRVDPEKETFYRELKPIRERFDPDAMAATGLDWNVLPRYADDPRPGWPLLRPDRDISEHETPEW